jgi:hypothetical protein
MRLIGKDSFILKVNANKVVSIDNLYVLDGSEEALLDRVSKQPVSVSLDGTSLQFYSGVSILYRDKVGVGHDFSKIESNRSIQLVELSYFIGWFNLVLNRILIELD